MKEMFNLHPYFGFMPKSGVAMRAKLSEERIERIRGPRPAGSPAGWLDLTANNHGFFSPHDYPLRGDPQDRPFIVGVFGGSVALWFALQEAGAFARELEAWPSVRGRRVLLLNFASGGFKQPQSRFCLEYFVSLRQPLDAVLLIDGFNDVALAYMNWTRGIDPTFPSSDHMQMFADIPNVAMGRVAGPPMPSDLLADSVADFWVAMATAMYRLCRDHHIPFLHLLQPNQYHSRRRFTKDELEFAVSETTPYRRAVELIYPKLVKAVERIKETGANSYDGSRLFDEVPETVYSDNCCHYNQLGNDLIRDFLIGRLPEVL